MPTQASRRTFLTLAGASVGLIATSVRGAQPREPGSSGPAGTDSEPPRGARPIERLSLATIVGFSGAELKVQLEESGLTYTLEPRDFGDWEHQIGDRVVVAEDPSGRRSVKPYVATVDAPLPRRPSAVEVGSVIQVGERSARIGSESVKEKYEAIRARSLRAEVHWLLIENVRTGELRVFGVIDDK